MSISYPNTHGTLADRKAGNVADEYKHLTTESLRRKRVVEAMKKCSGTKLKSGKPIDEVIKTKYWVETINGDVKSRLELFTV
jgi:hypothetical protein